MNSNDLGKYITATDSISQPWLLAQLRLQKLRDRSEDLTPEEYMTELQDIHQDLMKLGQWWQGQEDQVF